MSQTFNSDHPLFDVVVAGIRKVVDAVKYGIDNELGSVEIIEPDGEFVTITRKDFYRELEPALAFFEAQEMFEDCVIIKELMTIMDNEPNVEQIIRSITDSYNDNSSPHDA